MASLALRSTKWMLDIATRLVKANVRLHNIERVEDDMSVVFVANHFTRLETMLLPYILHKHLGREVWSLAADELFTGRIGRYLRSAGALSTRDPDRDRDIVRALLVGDHPWIIFPEGTMVKDKRVLSRRGTLEVFHRGERRPPHRGAAVLALRAEFYRRKLRCIHERPGRPGLRNALQRFGIASVEPVLAKRTVIVPVNITYYPMRSQENVFLRLARGMLAELSDRAIEELSLEGTVLARDTDIDITFGLPIEAQACLDSPECAPFMACSDHDLEQLEQDPRSLFNETAHRLRERYMREIYRLTCINHDHIFAGLLRHMPPRRFSARAFRERAFLAVHRLRETGRCNLHNGLESAYHDLAYDEPCPQLEEFLGLARREGALRGPDDDLERAQGARGVVEDFSTARRRALTAVIANELEGAPGAAAVTAHAARMTESVVERRVHGIFLREDLRLFEEDYARCAQSGESKPPEVGRPFLLTPSRIRASLVLVHGYMAAPLEVRAMADYFVERGYAVYGVRLKGHGTSPEDLARAPWRQWYDSVNRGYAVARSLSDAVVLGGFSMGGALALLAAARKRDRIRAVFSICAPLELRNYFARHASSVVAMNNLLNRLWGSPAPWYVENDAENKHINYARNPLTGVKELGELVRLMAAELPAITVPALVLQADGDPIVHPDSARRIFERVGSPHKELTFFHRDRHGIVNGDGREDVFGRIEQFLDWAEARRRRTGAPRPAAVDPAPGEAARA